MIIGKFLPGALGALLAVGCVETTEVAEVEGSTASAVRNTDEDHPFLELTAFERETVEGIEYKRPVFAVRNAGADPKLHVHDLISIHLPPALADGQKRPIHTFLAAQVAKPDAEAAWWQPADAAKFDALAVNAHGGVLTSQEWSNAVRIPDGARTLTVVADYGGFRLDSTHHLGAAHFDVSAVRRGSATETDTE